MSLKLMNSARFYDFSIDRLRCVLQWREQPVPINRKTFDLLLYLIDHRDRLVTKDELLENLWPDQFVEESNLTQHVFLLRKALSAQGGDQKIIQTVSRRGYRFTAPLDEDEVPAERMVLSAKESITRITVEEEEDDSAVSLSADPIRSDPKVLSRLGILPASDEVSAELQAPAALADGARKRHRLRWALVSCFAFAAIGLAGWFGWQHWLDRSGGAPVQVVLTPLEGSTGDSVLDKSLTQAMRMDLAQSPWVTVLPISKVSSTLKEMQHKPDDAMTQATAREVCERTNSQSVLSGTIAKVGQHFLLTEEASNCVDGSVIGQSKYEAVRLEELPHAVDQLAAALRRDLGESRRSIARFDTPLFTQNTPSLEALKALTQGVDIERRGDSPRAIPFFKLAVAADPSFAYAYYSLATSLANAGDFAAAREASAKAYSLRDTAGKSQAFGITALYNFLVTQDLYESLRNYENWASLYPNSISAWNGSSYVQANLGHFREAVVSERHALALSTGSATQMNDMALSLIQSGNPDEARKLLDQAAAMHLDDFFVRVRYFELAYLLHDESSLRAQMQWSDAHPDTAIVLETRAEIANAEGRFADARSLIARSNERFHEQGLEGSAEQYAKTLAVQMMEAGDVTDGQRIFSESPANLEEGNDVLGLAYSGDVSGAQSALHAMQAKFPKATLWNLYWGPLTQAAIALQQNKPKEAAMILETSRPVENRDLVVPWLRGNAYLAAGQPALAEADFRSVVTHPERDPTSPNISLSWLGLGRALAAEGKRGPAAEAYQHFLMLWSHADPDAKFLIQARSELKVLQTPAPTK